MPVTVLYCEGNTKSIDIRVIRQLLPQCDIRPLGGKNSNFLRSIIADRHRNPNLACLVDRDFDCQDRVKSDRPIQYLYKGKWVGWTWERKEIENYLIDPVVIEKALGKKAPKLDEYWKALDDAAEDISAYSAARTALTCENFQNCWGEKVGKVHKFPSKLGRNSCQEKIAEIVRDKKNNRLITEEDVTSKFRDLLPKFKRNGSRFTDYLHYFAGKDLLYAMRKSLLDWGFEDTSRTYSPEEVFIERIMSQIERIEKVWEWLPEWTTLRQFISETDFSKD